MVANSTFSTQIYILLLIGENTFIFLNRKWAELKKHSKIKWCQSEFSLLLLKRKLLLFLFSKGTWDYKE